MFNLSQMTNELLVTESQVHYMIGKDKSAFWSTF